MFKYKNNLVVRYVPTRTMTSYKERHLHPCSSFYDKLPLNLIQTVFTYNTDDTESVSREAVNPKTMPKSRFVLAAANSKFVRQK